MRNLQEPPPKNSFWTALCLLLWLPLCACATQKQPPVPVVIRETPPATLLLERPIPGPPQTGLLAGTSDLETPISGTMTVKHLVLWVEALLDHAARENMDKAALRLWCGEPENYLKNNQP